MVVIVIVRMLMVVMRWRRGRRQYSRPSTPTTKTCRWGPRTRVRRYLWREHVHFRRGQTAAHHATQFQARAHVERRAEPARRAERLAAGGGADNVDDGVDGADLVEMHLLDGNGMDRGLGLAEKLKGAAGAGFHGFGQRRGANNLEDRRERAVGRVRMLVGVRLGVRVCVRVTMIV